MNHRGKVSLAERVVNVVETQGLEDRRSASCFVLFCFSSDYESQVQVGGDVEVNTHALQPVRCLIIQRSQVSLSSPK